MEYDNLEMIELLATALHHKLCKVSHMDACGWDYEEQHNIIDWSGYAHSRYYEQAQELIIKWETYSVDIEQAIYAMSIWILN